MIEKYLKYYKNVRISASVTRVDLIFHQQISENTQKANETSNKENPPIFDDKKSQFYSYRNLVEENNQGIQLRDLDAFYLRSQCPAEDFSHERREKAYGKENEAKRKMFFFFFNTKPSCIALDIFKRYVKLNGIRLLTFKMIYQLITLECCQR